MTTTPQAGTGKPVFATAKLRSVEMVTFRLLPVPLAALPEWNHRLSQRVAA